MAHTYPYPLSFFSDVLPYGEVQGPFMRRFDERSGGGDSRFWTAQMATPLWAATAALPACSTAAEARAIEAKVQALDGMGRLFLFSPPQYLGPASGVATGLGAVSVGGISTDRGALSLNGLRSKFVVTAGDYLSIAHSTGRLYFGQFSEGGTATTSGFLSLKEVRPYLPLGISNGATVELVRPAFKAMIEDFTPFTVRSGGPQQPYGRDFTAYGASISILQKP